MRHRVESLLVLWLASAAGASWAADWPELPLPDGVQGQWVSKHMVHNGVPMRAARFDTPLPPSALVGFYQKKWPGQVNVTDLGTKKIVAHATGSHFITIEITGGAAGSQAQIGITEALKETPRKSPGEDFLKPAGTRVVTDTVYLDNPGRTLSMEVPLSAYQADAFYKARLPMRGWRHDGARPCSLASQVCSATYVKDKEQLVLTFNRNGERTDVVVNQSGR